MPSSPRSLPSLRPALLLASAAALVVVVGCVSVTTDAGTTDPDPQADGGAAQGPGSDGGTAAAVLNPAHFDADALAEPITEVTCTLSNGATTTCHRIVIRGEPTDHDVGPFCPRHIDDGPDVSGIWLEGGEVYDADGAFIAGLATFYDDDNWQLYDAATGEVRVTLTQEACEAAARPDVDPAYQNHCVECSLDDVGGGVEVEYLIPVVPVARPDDEELGLAATVGVALNGAHYDPPAPMDAILGAYTIAAFDDCGGHVNPFAGYHYHAATGCPKAIPEDDGHAPLIGYVLDGYALHAMVGDDGAEPDDLDPCRGHTDSVRGYHYHAASAGENMFIGCFHGEIVSTDDEGPGQPGGGQDALSCDQAAAGAPCCGDGICDGPETAANCSEDC